MQVQGERVPAGNRRGGSFAWTTSPEVRIMFGPDRAYAGLSQVAAGRSLLLKRPLFLAFVLGCTVSLITSGRFTFRLVTSAAVTWSFVPLIEIASLAAVWSTGRRIRPFRQSVDLFFMGHGPWLCWLLAFGIFWSSVSPISESTVRTWLWIGSAGAIGVWSAYIDFRFFRRVLERDAAVAIRDLLVQRAVAWGAGILLFGAGSLWSNIVRRLHL